VGIFIVGMLTAATAAGQAAGGESAAGAAAGPADASGARVAEPSGLRRNEGMVVLDYQVIAVPGDEPIDLMGLHVHNKVSDWLYVGVGVYAPLVRGGYGGFMAFDVGAHLQQRLTTRLSANAGFSAGGGGGGRSAEQSKELSGTGGFVKAYVGLGYDFSSFSVGVNVARMKFKNSAIDDTFPNLFVQMPFSYLAGPFSGHGEVLSPADARLASGESAENMLTVVLDNLEQIDPRGSNKGTINIADLQYAHFFARDTYWFAALGVGYHGRALYNQLLGGIGRRVRLSPHADLYAQLGVGSGGYAPDVIDTGAGLLVYPKVSAEYALTKDLGLALSAGYLVAPEGSSRNFTYGLALNYHLRSGDRGAAGSEPAGPATYRGFRFSLFQQTEYNVRYGDVDRDQLQMLAAQVDTLVSEHWYIPLQIGVAYDAYLGLPGYGELLAGIGVQNKAGPGDRVQFFGQLMAGTNVHGPAVKASAGLHYGLGDRWSLHLSTGKTKARHPSGRQFSADSLGLGLDYRFSIPGW
jgi:hypothetical protein